MDSRNEIQFELRELNSQLPCDRKEPVFVVPPGYFENFAASVLSRIKAENLVVSVTDELNELSPTLATLSKKMPFSVPANYFENVLTNIPALTEDEALPSFLTEKKEMPYSVPNGYFEQFADEVLKKAGQSGGKVVQMRTRKWQSYAVAAMLLGLIALSGIFYFSRKPAPDPANPEWIAKGLEGVSNQALEEFIKTTDISPNGKSMAGGSNNVEVRKMLKDVSDNELEAFLAAVPTDDEELLIIN